MVESATEASAAEAGASAGPTELVRRPVLWTLGTAFCLTFGFMAIVYALTQLAIGVRPEAEVRSTQTALVLYGRIVLVKALWPHVALTAPLYLLLQSATSLGGARRMHQCAAFIALAMGTATVLTAFVLPSEAFGLAAVRPGNAANFVATVLELTAGTTAAATLARWLTDKLPGR